MISLTDSDVAAVRKVDFYRAEVTARFVAPEFLEFDHFSTGSAVFTV